MGVSHGPKLLCSDCIADEAAGVRTNWYSALQDLLSKVFWGQMIHSSTIDVATGQVEIDMCMTRWRDFYGTALCGLGGWRWTATHPAAPTDGVTRCTYLAWFASDLPTDGSHWKPAPCITAPNIPYPHNK
jgi:hypothetical protein